MTDLPSTSNDDGCRKSFPFENEEHRLSAMQSLAEHNAYLNETNTASSLAKNSFKDWTMPGKKVFKGNDISDDLEPHPPRYLIRRIELSLQAPLTECIRPLSSLFDPKDECDRKKTLFFFCS